MRGPQLRPGVHPAVLAAQPLAVQQVSAGQFRAELSAAEPVDRLAVQALGGLALAHQRTGAGLDPEAEVGPARLGMAGQPVERLAGQVGIAAADRGLDQLGQRPHRRVSGRGVLAGRGGRGQRLLVPAQAVGHDGGRPVRVGHRDALARGRGLGDGGLDERRGLGPATPQRGQHHRGERRGPAAGRLANRVGLRDQSLGRREVTAPGHGRAERAQQERQPLQRAGLPGEPELPGQHRAPRVVVPQRAGGALSQPAPAKFLPRGDVRAGEGVNGLPQGGGRGGRPVGDHQRQAVQDQVDRPRRPGLVRREGAGGAGDLEQITGAGQPPGEQRRHPGGQVGLPRQVQVERLEPLGRLEQQRRRVAAQPRREHDLPAQQVHPGALQLIQRPGLRRGQQLQGRPERPGLHVGPRRGERPLGPAGRINAQQHRTLQKRRGRGQPAAGLGPVRGPLQLGRHLLIRPGCGLGPVPGPPIWLGLGVGDLSQRPVHLLPVLDRRGPVGHRAQQRVPEPHLGPEFHPDAQPLRRPPHQRRVAVRLGRGQQQQPPGLVRQGRQLPPEAALDPPRQPRAGQCTRQAEPAGQLGRGQPPGQFQQRQRVALGLGHDQVPDPGVQRPGQRRVQQRPGLVVRQPLDVQFRQAGQHVARLAGREHQGDRVGGQPPGGEAQGLRRRRVQPRLVVDHADQRALLGHVAEQAEHRQPDQEPVRRRPGADPERNPQRVALRWRQVRDLVQHRRAQLMEPGEGQRYLGLHARRARHPAPGGRGPRGQVVEQHGLAHARLAADHQGAALPGPDRLDESVEGGTFAVPAG